MKKILIILTLLPFILNSCQKSDKLIIDGITVDYQAELQKIVDTHWDDFVDGRDEIPGGYALQILSPAGDYFVSTGDLINATNQTHFRAASVTKTFTAAAVVLLHQQKKLSINHFLTDTIPGTSITYLPESDEFDIPFKDKITIKMLLQHRSGMWDVINQDIPDNVNQPYAGMRYVDYVMDILGEPEHTFTTTEMVKVVADNQLFNTPPDEGFHYSNTGMSILGFIIERISGMRYDQFVKEKLLIPNGLNNTTFPYLGNDQTIPSPYADSYAYIDGEILNFTVQNASQNVAEGNVITTPEDLSKWITNLYSGNAGIDYKYVKFLMMDCLPTYESHQNYGLGTVYTPALGYGHNGGKIGFFTSTRYDPETEITYVIYTNVWDFDAFSFDLYTQMTNLYGVVYAAKDILKQ